MAENEIAALARAMEQFLELEVNFEPFELLRPEPKSRVWRALALCLSGGIFVLFVIYCVLAGASMVTP